MRIPTPCTVVVCRRDPAQTQALVEILWDRFKSQAVQFDHFEKLEDYMKERQPVEGVKLAILTHDLRGFGRSLEEKFEGLNCLAKLKGKIVILTTREFDKDKLAKHAEVELYSGGYLDKQNAEQILHGLLLVPPANLQLAAGPKKPVGEVDSLLEAMVRKLDVPQESHDTATHGLGVLVRASFDSDSAEVRRLVQGHSGASVFRVSKLARLSGCSYALKVFPSADLPKIWNELNHWAEIEAAFDPKDRIRRVPRLHHPVISCEEDDRLVTSGGFYAVTYEFFGEDDEIVLNLKDSYRMSSSELQQYLQEAPDADGDEPAVDKVLASIISLLRRAFYDSGQIQQCRKLWNPRGPGPKEPCVPPWYSLSAEQQTKIRQSLEELTRIGNRLLPECWSDDVKFIEDWISLDPRAECLRRVSPVLVSKVHGDLNSENVMYWVNEKQPLFIDFTCYQPQGATFQDFTRLEVAIKYELMDQQEDDAPDAYDLTWDRLYDWCNMETHLASSDSEEESNVTDKSVLRALRLVQILRASARDIRKDVASRSEVETNESDFVVEYHVALLYHTLRAITYLELSPFKRLLAVRSAGHLIKQLEEG